MKWLPAFSLLTILLPSLLVAQLPTVTADTDYAKGQTLQKGLKFDSAIFFYKKFLEKVKDATVAGNSARKREVNKRITECTSGILLVSAPREFVIQNVGPEINSPYEDYGPVLNADGTLMIFTSRRPDGNLNQVVSDDGKFFEDVYFSIKENETWKAAQNIGAPVNTTFHNSDLGLSADGHQLFLYTDENEGDILTSRLVNGKWSAPQSLPWPINTPYHESSVSITADGKRLFVASERPGGKGGSDIYMFEKKSTGQWSPGVNLGTAVNTEWDEDSPFIDYDGKTLYFSSSGHNAMGGHDIFRSRWSETGWSPAENLGYPINTPDHDSYFASTRDGKGAYYSSVRPGGYGQEDIYYITLPKELTREDTQKTLSPSSDEIYPKKTIIYFAYGSSSLTADQIQELNEFAQSIKNLTQYRIIIEGHTDNSGLEKTNDGLARDRAHAVMDHLTSKGISLNRMEQKGWGASKPVASNAQEVEGRALNRRVEVRVIHD